MELSHTGRLRPSAPPPLRERLARARTTYRHVGWAIVAVALVAAAVGWQVGGTRARTAAQDRLESSPPVLAWLIDDGPKAAARRRTHTP